MLTDKFGINGAAVILACGPAPAEFTALTLKVWFPLGRPWKVWVSAIPTDAHAPLFRATSYLDIAAPPLLAGADQLRVTCPAPSVLCGFCGALGAVTCIGVVNVFSLL